MGKLITFVKRQQTKSQAKKIESGIVEGPFQPNLPIVLEFDEVMISAINFINEYMGHYHLDNTTMFLYGFTTALKSSTHLLSQAKFNISGNFDWFYGQSIEKVITSQDHIILKDVTLFNDLCNIFPEKEYSTETLVEDIMNNYIESFLNYFNIKDATISFSTHQEARINAMKNGNGRLISVIDAVLKERDFEMTFRGIGEKIDNWDVAFYKKEEPKKFNIIK